MPFSRVVEVTLHTPLSLVRVPFFVCPGILGILHLDPITLMADVRLP